MLNIVIPPSAPVTKEERERWLKKAEYGGKTRRLVDHLNQAEAERDALANALWTLDAPPCLCLNYDTCPRQKDCGADNPDKGYCWLEWARKEAGEKG